MSSQKAETAVREGRVKLHVFEPSGRRVWTVVGKRGEYWVDETEKFCSCQAHYFATMQGRPSCYHEESVVLAAKTVRPEYFPDSQYDSFVAEIAAGFFTAVR